jgi:acetyltransferase-like isoleucine patch superfamily enzyme
MFPDMVHKDAFIHPQAFVEASRIGARTKIWQFASVIRGSVLGEDCAVANCSLLDGAWVGHRSIISQCCSIGPGFYIGNDVFIGPLVTFCNDRFPATNKVDFHPEILRDDFITIKIKDGASVGANSVLLPGIVIGEKALVAAGSAVKKNVPDNHLHRRDGSLVEIKEEWRHNRMVEASCLL